MGATIQFESHRVELPIIYEFEYDEEVLEFYDQPSPIKLDYQRKNWRNLGKHPDSCYFYSCKS